MKTINITPLKDRYILDGWNILMSYESYLSVIAQRSQYEKNQKGLEIASLAK